MARPKKYANAAEKQAAYRARYKVIDARLQDDTVAALDRIAADLDVPRTEVISSLLKFALTNRNWLQLGLFGKRLPNAAEAAFFKRIKGPEDGDENT